MKKKIALILDNIDRGTIQTTLQTNGYQKKLKILNSSVKNWESICEFIDDNSNEDIIIIGKFTEHTLFRMCLPQYEKVVNDLIKRLTEVKHLIFIYKANVLGEFSYFSDTEFELPQIDNEDDYFKYYSSNVKNWLSYNDVTMSEAEYINKVQRFIKRINNDLKILPYEKLIDVEVSGQNFIENIAEGLLFRIYIPNDRIWSSEFSKFFGLFRDYTSSVANEELKISQDKTDLGIICSIYSINKIPKETINKLYKDFTTFMDLCATNPDEAEKILDSLNFDDSKKRTILTKYIKESQRLSLDLKQEKERKILEIKHRLQNEINELEIDENLQNYIENSFPNNLNKMINNSPLNIDKQNIFINSQIIQKVEGIVANEINGNIEFDFEEKQIENLIEKYSADITEKTELTNSLYELKDNSISKEIKRTSWQKLYGFIAKVGDKVGDVGVALLTKYLEQKIGL